MPAFNIRDLTPFTPVPGCRLRTPHGENLMLSYLEMDSGAVIPMHQHPHEQGGIVLKGRLELTIDGRIHILEEGEMYLVPPNVPHQAVAVDGPVVAMDVFTPIREDYVAQSNAWQQSQAQDDKTGGSEPDEPGV